MIFDRGDIDGFLSVYERDWEPLEEFRTTIGCGRRVLVVCNVVTNLFWQDLFQTAAGTPTNSVVIAYVGLGNQASPSPARTDVTLGNEIARYQSTSFAFSNADPPNGVYSFFIPAGTTQTFTEAGMFHGPASAVLGTGRLTSRVAFSYTQPSNTDVRIDYTLTRSTLV